MNAPLLLITQIGGEELGIAAGSAMLVAYGFSCLFTIALLVAGWKILAKMGHPGLLIVVTLIPIANIVLLFWLAFSEWPIEREVARLERRAQGHGYSAAD